MPLPAPRILPSLALVVALSAVTTLADEAEFFETHIRPVLVAHCYECHAGGEAKAGLRLDFRPGWERGGESGPAIQPGHPRTSLLLRALRHESEELRMPKNADKLPDEVIAAFETWIAAGAFDPRDEPPSDVDAAEEAWKAKLRERSRWWSLQPPKPVKPPVVDDTDWGVEPVDRFVIARLRKENLAPAPPAGPEVLLRRLSFVLTGLPPKPERVNAFRAEWHRDSETAWAEAVDAFLESPHFGERFARHWMDVVRYTDTYGYEWDIAAKGSWEYRDYLIRAFNADVGFDQLIREHLAGDLLPKPRISEVAGVNESLIGPMFFHFGERRHGNSQMFNGIHQDMVDSQIDAFSKAFLAMTVACARCHDHKLDAISQRDYYALASVFMTPRWTSRTIDAPGRHSAQIAELKHLREEIRGELARRWVAQIGSEACGFPKLREWAEGKSPAPEDVGHPIAGLAAARDENALLSRWNELATEWQRTRDNRQEQNAAFTVLTNFSEPGFPDGWVTEGDGVVHGYVSDGTPLIALEGDRAITQILPRGYHTHALSSKLPGAVRAPDPSTFPRAKVRVKITGGEWAGRSAVPQNAFLNEGPVFFDPAKPLEWMPVEPSSASNGVTRVLTDFATASMHPNFPPRTGVAKMGGVRLPDEDDGFDKRSWFSLTGIVADDEGRAPVDTLDAFAKLYQDGPEPSSAAEIERRLETWLGGAVERFAEDACEAGDVPVLNWLLTEGLLTNSINASANLASLVQRYREVEATIHFPRSANSMDERGLKPIDYRFNVRGDVYQDGAPVPHDFLEVFAGRHHVQSAKGSGRLELADYLASADNPQTARVYVNRVWQWVFGTGIVDTPSDFGKLGGRPSHPDLLDWLALQFIRDNWSTKRLVRRLVLSQTFRQSGRVSADASERDPDNRLLHHHPTRRLEAEAIRDALLAVSGRLDPTLYGRWIRPHRAAEDSKKRLFSGPLDGHGRRSIYLQMSIMQPPEFLVGFNLPDLKIPTGRRDVTNVPAQALTLLNDPFVNAMAGHWAAQLLQDGRTGPVDRLQAMFLAALGRSATDDEVKRWLAFIESEPSTDPHETWKAVAHTLFNTKEFLYYR